MQRFHPLGIPGQPWTPADRRAWYEGRRIQRSHHDEVLRPLLALGRYEPRQYGSLDVFGRHYPLHAVVARCPQPGAPWALVTGGVHGYETSGVQGALAFLQTTAERYTDRLNLVVVPCVSPWSYEVIQRWNPHAIDPNRSFVADSGAAESRALMDFIAGLQRASGVGFSLHIDLHETTDSDESEFRPALAARDGKPFEPGHIPDGFYTVGDTQNPQPAFQAAIVTAVEAVTHIAEADARGEIIGSPVVQRGVILYPFVALGLCAGMTRASYTSTTEVYPNSPRETPEICNRAQVAAVCGALDHALAAP